MLANYYVLDYKIGRSDFILKCDRDELIVYQTVKKKGLMLLYACAFNSANSEVNQREKLLDLITDELLSGVDETQLSLREIAKIPNDYIRQVCFLPPTESGSNVDYGEEMVVEESQKLTKTYQ